MTLGLYWYKDVLETSANASTKIRKFPASNVGGVTDDFGLGGGGGERPYDDAAYSIEKLDGITERRDYA